MPTILRTLSESTTLQSARVSLPDYYDPGVSTDEAARVLSTTAGKIMYVNPRCVAALYLIVVHAMRSCEYLCLQARDIMEHDRVLIRGRKGSGSYMLVLPGISNQYRDARSVDPARFVSGCNYRQLYRACVRADIGMRIRTRINLSRTHSGRYTLAAELTGEKILTTRDCLRHRSLRSTIHYMAREV